MALWGGEGLAASLFISLQSLSSEVPVLGTGRSGCPAALGISVHVCVWVGGWGVFGDRLWDGRDLHNCLRMVTLNSFRPGPEVGQGPALWPVVLGVGTSQGGCPQFSAQFPSHTVTKPRWLSSLSPFHATPGPAASPRPGPHPPVSRRSSSLLLLKCTS